MKQRKTHLIIASLVIVAAFCLIGLSQLNAQNFGSKTSGPTKVAVCHLGDLFSKYQRAKDMLDKLEKIRQEFMAEGQKRIAVLEDLNQQLGGYVEGKPEYQKLFDKIQSGTIELEVWKKMQQQSILTKHMAMTKVIYQQMTEAIAEVSKERGLDLVIQFDPQKIEAQNAQEWQMKVQMRQVLYNDPNMDITAAVLQKLDETYRVTKSK
jgi:Skp family chaperone for outer membrane proteins